MTENDVDLQAVLRTLTFVEAEWAIEAAAYARAQVTPRYYGQDQPTNYEKGQIQNVAAIFRDGYLTALRKLAAALPSEPAREGDR